eukprot:768818-Hanusia_phi.AAC.8
MGIIDSTIYTGENISSLPRLMSLRSEDCQEDPTWQAELMTERSAPARAKTYYIDLRDLKEGICI